MLNRAESERQKEMKKITEEYYDNLLKNYGKDCGDLSEKIIEYKGVEYEESPAWKEVVDNIDDYGSIDASHRHSLGFSWIIDYNGNPETLDFRFMRIQDRVGLLIPKDNLKEMFFYATNAANSYIEGHNRLHYDITVDSFLLEFVVNLKNFLKLNIDTIDSINFQGVYSKTMIKIIILLCHKNGI